MKLLYKRSALGCLDAYQPTAGGGILLCLPLGAAEHSRYSSFAFSGLLILDLVSDGTVPSNWRKYRQSPTDPAGFPTAILPVVTVMTGLIHFLLALGLDALSGG